MKQQERLEHFLLEGIQIGDTLKVNSTAIFALYFGDLISKCTFWSKTFTHVGLKSIIKGGFYDF